MCKQMKFIILSLTTMFIFTACSLTARDADINDSPVPSETVSIVSKVVTIPPIEQVDEPEDVKMFSDEEVQAIVRTLAGECYDDKLEDKKKVTEVILNRVSNEKFGKTVTEVVSAKGQFCGYWKQSRPVSESDIQIAEETLERWYTNDCKALSEYLFFRSGPNRENVFRVKY